LCFKARLFVNIYSSTIVNFIYLFFNSKPMPKLNTQYSFFSAILEV
jgi:hypothetical protein